MGEPKRGKAIEKSRLDDALARIEDALYDETTTLIKQLEDTADTLDEKNESKSGGQVKEISIARGVLLDKLLVVGKGLREMAAGTGGEDIEEYWEDVIIEEPDDD